MPVQKIGTYLSVSAVASFNDLTKRKKELFNLITKAWFPEGDEDPSLLLLRSILTKPSIGMPPQASWCNYLLSLKPLLKNKFMQVENMAS